MQIYNLPKAVKGIIFDIDSTLYTCPKYVFEQVDIQVRHFAHLRGMSEDTARTVIGKWRKEWSGSHGGRKISLGNTLLNFGISIAESIEWRKTLLKPALYLHKDYKMRACLTSLKKRFNIICVTNNPLLPAQKTLEAIGIDDLFINTGCIKTHAYQCADSRASAHVRERLGIIALDTCCVSKPAREPFEMALDAMGIRAAECVSVGDRYDIDISLPLEMGMGGILVGGAADVLLLGEVLKGN